jgi:NAD-dependent SIR2 family protein deacetylase
MTAIDIITKRYFVKTDKNREQVLNKHKHRCIHCRQEAKKEDDLDVYIFNFNMKPHTIVPLCKSCHNELMRHVEAEEDDNKDQEK